LANRGTLQRITDDGSESFGSRFDNGMRRTQMGRMKRVVHVLGITGIIFGSWTTGALAANRYASPTGSGTSCNLATPCSIVTAINDANANDDVTIEPGTYGSHATPLSTPLTDPAYITIHGQAGQPRPVIYTTANPGIGISHGSRLSGVDVEDNNSSIRGSAIEVVSQAATIDHVTPHAIGPNIEVGCTVIGSLIDSVCWSSGPDGYGVRVVDSGPFSQSATLRNDTLIATNTGGYGAVANSSGGWTVQMTLINSIQRVRARMSSRRRTRIRRPT
jgi:hypothetical protein